MESLELEFRAGRFRLKRGESDLLVIGLHLPDGSVLKYQVGTKVTALVDLHFDSQKDFVPKGTEGEVVQVSYPISGGCARLDETCLNVIFECHPDVTLPVSLLDVVGGCEYPSCQKKLVEEALLAARGNVFAPSAQ